MTELVNTGGFARNCLTDFTRAAIARAMTVLENNFHDTVSWDDLPLTLLRIHASENPPALLPLGGARVAFSELPSADFLQRGGAGAPGLLMDCARLLLDRSNGLGHDTRTDPAGLVVGLAAIGEVWMVDAGDAIDGVLHADNPAAVESRFVTAVLADGTVLNVFRARGQEPFNTAPVNVSRYPEDHNLAPALWLLGQGLGHFSMDAAPV
ncbi:hypothetical protein [Kitasatospora aureofaciens]|uniref:hypothetical protein n=1 Tax=Kitasatospora aureofaciens TaxID=1894 RepID=UPI0005240B86|nr:hypothetical protein [Kitasatospora aureofaciens]